MSPLAPLVLFLFGFCDWLCLTHCRPSHALANGYPVPILEALRNGGVERLSKTMRQNQTLSGYNLGPYVSEDGTTGTLQRPSGKKQVEVVVPNRTVAMSMSSRGAAEDSDMKENELHFGLQFTLSAEALHKERMALESVVEPWGCVVNVRYVSCLCSLSHRFSKST